MRFALTSGQACVYYGIQQTTKDSDWIIELADIAKLVALLQELDTSEEMRVSYREICGAPFSEAYLGHGWTTHVRITDTDGDLHHLDFFGKAPRVVRLERDASDPDFASRHVVAQMKKTDREKDWPFVAALSRQAIALADPRGLLHGYDVDWLIQTWTNTTRQIQVDLIQQRPVLVQVTSEPAKLRRSLMIEKFIWQAVNRGRYRIFQRAWKEFFRRWRREPSFQWPAQVSFREQCLILLDAAGKYGLPLQPLDQATRAKVLSDALVETADVFAASDAELKKIAPPLDVLLP